MSDLRALNDAFGELERRADAVSGGLPADRPPRAGSRLVPVAVAVAVVAGLATGTALLVPDGGSGGAAGAQQTAPNTTVATPVPTTATTAAEAGPPETPEELIARFQAVLGGTGSFTVTGSGPGVYRMTLPPPSGAPQPTDVPLGTGESDGAALVGLLTASGVTGGFDLVVHPGDQPIGPARCDLPDSPDCTVRTLPDGSSLATDRTTLEGGGVTHLALLHRADGLVVSMHVSSRRNPKGAGEQLSDQPPLTVEQLVGIVTSDRW